MVAQPHRRRGDRFGLGWDDAARGAVVHDLERPTRVGRCDHRLAGEERLVRPETEVLVDGRVVGGKAGGVEIGELFGRHTTGEAHPRSEPAIAGELLEPRAVRTVACHDDLQHRLDGGRFEEQVDPLRPVEPIHRQHEVAVPVVPVGELLGGMGQHLGDEPCRPLEPARDVLRGREQPCCLAEPDAVEFLHLPANRAILGRFAELTEVGAVELVGLPELVYEPHALLRMLYEVRGELRRDDHVDALAIGLGQIEQAPEKRLGQHAGAGIPLERHGDAVRLVAAHPQLLDERVAEDLCPTARERHLWSDDRYPHRRPSASFREALSPLPRAGRPAPAGRRSGGALPH